MIYRYYCMLNGAEPQSKCETCPFYMDDCDGEDSIHVCHNPEYVEFKKED